MSERSTEARAPAIRLGAWSFYFFAKFLLYWRELIGFHPLENIAFAAFLLAPLSPAWRRARNIAAIPAAIALLYYDSWLPPIGRVLSQASLVTNFSADYLMELAARVLNWQVIALLVLAWAAYRITARHIRTGAAAMAGLLVLTAAPLFQGAPQVAAGTEPAAQGAAAPADPDAMLRAFYAAEAKRSVHLPTAGGTPFDIVFLHICSLSWDDLQASGLDQHPLWANFDFLFTRFNSAASYSGPAAIRINRALCGQTPHKGLYDAAGENCYLFPNLQRAGFETSLAMNHDGHFDDFLQLIRQQGVSTPLMPLDGVPVPQRGFDNSPIHDDLAVLTRWLDSRSKGGAERVALFYNTISLHDGNTLTSGAKPNTEESYRLRATKLFNDINAFFTKVKQSGRRVIVVVVPEHGAALRGDKFQFAGLREMATPRITTVPVGVKVIGAERQGEAVKIATPSSYIALSQLTANLIGKPPYGTDGFAAGEYAAQLPATDYVAENEGTVIIGRNGGYLIRQGSEPWKDYAAD